MLAYPPETPWIALTKDPEQKAKLQRKLAEYKKRLRGQAPEVDKYATYKLLILEQLLDAGFISQPLCYGRWAREYGWHNVDEFKDAFQLIAKYNDNELKGISGGTGLH